MNSGDAIDGFCAHRQLVTRSCAVSLQDGSIAYNELLFRVHQKKRHPSCLCVSDGYTVDAALTHQPVNTATLAGTSVTLRCTTDQLRSSVPIAWRRNPDTVVDRIVNFNCQPDSAFPEYTVSSTSAGQCDLIINNASLALAATYACIDDTGVDAGSATAELTVIGESYCLLLDIAPY